MGRQQRPPREADHSKKPKEPAPNHLHELSLRTKMPGEGRLFDTAHPLIHRKVGRSPTTFHRVIWRKIRAPTLSVRMGLQPALTTMQGCGLHATRAEGYPYCC